MRFDHTLGRWVDDKDPSTFAAATPPPPPPVSSLPIVTMTSNVAFDSRKAPGKSARSRYVDTIGSSSGSAPTKAHMVPIPSTMPISGNAASFSPAIDQGGPEREQQNYASSVPSLSIPSQSQPSTIITPASEQQYSHSQQTRHQNHTPLVHNTSPQQQSSDQGQFQYYQ